MQFDLLVERYLDVLLNERFNSSSSFSINTNIRNLLRRIGVISGNRDNRHNESFVDELRVALERYRSYCRQQQHHRMVGGVDARRFNVLRTTLTRQQLESLLLVTHRRLMIDRTSDAVEQHLPNI